MAIVKTILAAKLGGTEIYQSDATATADDAIASSGTLRIVEIDNTLNTSASYVKLYDNASPTVGTTAPDFCFLAPASKKLTYICNNGSDFTNLSLACTTAGGTAGTGSPTNDVKVRILVT